MRLINQIKIGYRNQLFKLISVVSFLIKMILFIICPFGLLRVSGYDLEPTSLSPTYSLFYHSQRKKSTAEGWFHKTSVMVVIISNSPNRFFLELCCLALASHQNTKQGFLELCCLFGTRAPNRLNRRQWKPKRPRSKCCPLATG